MTEAEYQTYKKGFEKGWTCACWRLGKPTEDKYWETHFRDGEVYCERARGRSKELKGNGGYLS